MPRALYGSRSIRSIFPDSTAPSRSRPRCSSVADELLEIAPEPLRELAPLQLGQLQPDALERAGEAVAHEGERGVEVLGRHALAADLLRQAREEAVQRRVC